MVRIKISVMISDKTVIGRVLWVDKSLIGTRTIYTSKTNNMTIMSVCSPELDDCHVYVWGTHKASSNNIMKKNFATNTDALSYADRLCKTINEFNKVTNGKDYITFATLPFENKETDYLSFDIIQWDMTLILKCTGIIDSDRGKKYITTDKFELLSGNHPDSSSTDSLYVRGTNKQRDNDIITVGFDDYLELMNYIINLREAVKKWNNNDIDTISVTGLIT